MHNNENKDELFDLLDNFYSDIYPPSSVETETPEIVLKPHLIIIENESLNIIGVKNKQLWVHMTQLSLIVGLFLLCKSHNE
jgi:hypothetical protein